MRTVKKEKSLALSYFKDILISAIVIAFGLAILGITLQSTVLMVMLIAYGIISICFSAVLVTISKDLNKEVPDVS